MDVNSEREKRAHRGVHFYDPRVLRLLTFLTRRQAWLSPEEIAHEFRPSGRPMHPRTIYRWFSALEEQVALAYFPSPRMNRLDLQEVVVRIHGVRHPNVLSTVPFSHSFSAEVNLAGGRPFITQEYWIPQQGMKDFTEYWRAARELGLLRRVEFLPVRNTHFLFSPFEDVIGREGLVNVERDTDNRYFEALVGRQLREPHDVRIGEEIAASPVSVPLILEHLWGHYSSRHVWAHVRTKGGEGLWSLRRGRGSSPTEKRGRVLRLLQEAWQYLLERFDDVFLQPVVFVPPALFRNSVLLSLLFRPDSAESVVEAAARVSQKSVFAVLQPGLDASGPCRVWSVTPPEQLPAVVRLVGDRHAGPEPASIGIVDLDATRRLLQPEFCRFEWRLFDPDVLRWGFDGTAYIEALTALTAPEGRVRGSSANSKWPDLR